MNTQAAGMGLESWTGDMGRLWLANLQRFEGMIQPIGAAALTHAAFKPGERVIDIGCGGGGTSIAIARSVSPGGHVTGLDISPDLIAASGARASLGTQSDINFICADAATVRVTGAPFDRMFSRFGSMFFEDPKAAFRNLRAMLRTGGRVDLVVWANPDENPWIRTIQGVIAEDIIAPETPPDPRAPGPFSFGDMGWLTEVLEQAGFADIEATECRRDLPIGGAGASPAEAADFVIATMAIVGQVPEEKQAAVRERLLTALTPHHVPGKGVLLEGYARLVTARAV